MNKLDPLRSDDELLFLKDCFGDILTIEEDLDNGSRLYLNAANAALLEEDQVLDVYKVLKKWLRKRGVLVKKERGPELFTGILFSGNDIMQEMPLAVVHQDEEGHIFDVLWERNHG